VKVSASDDEQVSCKCVSFMSPRRTAPIQRFEVPPGPYRTAQAAAYAGEGAMVLKVVPIVVADEGS
jgi:hypothetical protein